MASVGTGKYTYELTTDWAKLPAGESFGVVSAVATDSQDRVTCSTARSLLCWSSTAMAAT